MRNRNPQPRLFVSVFSGLAVVAALLLTMDAGSRAAGEPPAGSVKS